MNRTKKMTTHDVTAEYLFTGYRLDARHKRLFNPDGGLVTLSSRPFDVLLTLVQHGGAIVSREELMEAVWPTLVVEEHNLTQAISIVRKALNDTTSESHFIRTVPGRGYCFITAVEKRTAAIETEHARTSFITRGLTQLVQYLRPAAGFIVLMSMFAAFVVLKPESGATQASMPSTSPPAPLGVSDIPQPDSRIRNSVAVLPLVTLSAKSDKLFAAGLHDEIISQLTQAGGLSVIARSSVLSLVEQGLSTLDLSRVLRVESVLSGTIRLAGTHARISLQLVDVGTGVTLWSGSYDVDQDDLAEMISIQGDIAMNVASALRMEMQPTEPDDFTALPTELAGAYRYHLAAQKAHHHQNYAEEWRLAQKALELDPDFYDALYTFASVNAVLVANPLPGMTSHQHAELALAHAIRMIQIAPERSEGYALKARTLAGNRDWSGVAAALGALEEMGADLTSLEYVAPPIMSLGDFERAVAIYEANLDAELLNPYGRGFLMIALELAGRRDEARRQYELGQELHSQWWGDAVNVFLALGRNETVSDVGQLIGISDDLKRVLTRLDDTDAVRAALAAYQRKPVKPPIEARYYAALAAQLGEHDVAVDLLRTSMQEVWSGLFWIWLPVFDDTRQQPGFHTLLRESGLVSYWQLHGWPRSCRALGDDLRCDWRAYPTESVPRTPIARNDARAVAGSELP